MIGKELKVYDGLTPRQQLNLFRNLYYNDGNATEHGIIANAINDCFAADVVPKSEIALKVIHQVKNKVRKYKQNVVNPYEHIILYLNELEKKYTEGNK
jgi:hypothetical protein